MSDTGGGGGGDILPPAAEAALRAELSALRVENAALKCEVVDGRWRLLKVEAKSREEGKAAAAAATAAAESDRQIEAAAIAGVAAVAHSAEAVRRKVAAAVEHAAQAVASQAGHAEGVAPAGAGGNDLHTLVLVAGEARARAQGAFVVFPLWPSGRNLAPEHKAAEERHFRLAEAGGCLRKPGAS